ncbi:hypothetical protein LINPERHAP1_LOCUS15339 [Linum perenne]
MNSGSVLVVWVRLYRVKNQDF